MISLLMQFLNFTGGASRLWGAVAEKILPLMGLTLLLAACATTQSETVKTTHPRVLLVNTNSAVERYAIVEESFQQSLHGAEITSIDLQNDMRPVESLQDHINNNNYDAVYTIGAKALGSLDYISPDMPIVFSSVLNWRRFNDHPNVYGVASEISPQAQLTWLKHFFPGVLRVGVIYSADNVSLINEANKVARQLDISLLAVNAFSSANVLDQAESLLGEVDMLWLISDPKVLSTTDGTKALFKLADSQQKPVFAYSDIFAEYGAVLSVSSDVATTGRQASLIIQQLLSKGRPDREVQFPAGSSITLNLDRVEKYGLNLNEEALESVSRIIRSKE